MSEQQDNIEVIELYSRFSPRSIHSDSIESFDDQSTRWKFYQHNKNLVVFDIDQTIAKENKRTKHQNTKLYLNREQVLQLTNSLIKMYSGIPVSIEWGEK